MTVLIDDYCAGCDRTHRAEVLTWSEDGEPVEVRPLEPCAQALSEEER